MPIYPSKVANTHLLNNVVMYVRTMGRTCHIIGDKVHIEVERQTPSGAIYNVIETASTIEEAKNIIMDD